MKYEFASDQWLAAVHGIMAYSAKVRLALSPDYRISICEVYRDVPADRADPNGRLAWSCVSEGDQVVFERRERDDVDAKFEVDFSTALALGRLESCNPELRRGVDAAIHAGRMIVTRREPAAASSDPFIHDLVVRITA